jgi:DNA-binding MarR family transcriptional regulator
VAQDDSDEFDHRNTLPFVIVRLGPVLQQTFAEAIAREGLTVRHFGVLVQFAGGRPMTAAAIARALQVAPQSVGPHIDTLVADGLLTRTPRPGRGRPNELRLTAEGEARLRRALTIARAEQARVTAHMSPAQRRTMLDQLREMAERAQRRRDDDG